MKHSLLPTQELLAEYLELDPSIPQGLRWKKKAARNTVIGSPAGRCHLNGYWEVRFQKTLWKTNRIVYRLATGEDPGELEVDHIDLNKNNNSASNLRAATRSEQQLNRLSTNEYRWTSYVADKAKWAGGYHTPRPNRKYIFCGYHKTAKQAYQAVLKRKGEVELHLNNPRLTSNYNGYKNVSFDKGKKRIKAPWVAHVRQRVDGKRTNKFLGYHANPYIGAVAAVAYKREIGMRYEYAPGGTK
jgi:hypothetical protein